MAYSAMDLVERPSRVSAASTADKAPINFSGSYVDGSALPAGTHSSAYAGAQLAATGGSGAGYAFAVVNELPPGLVMNGSGAISGTPLYATNATIVFTVTDNAGNSVSAKMTLAVA